MLKHPHVPLFLQTPIGTALHPAQRLTDSSVLLAAAQATFQQAPPMAHALVVDGRRVPTPWYAPAAVAAAAVAVSRDGSSVLSATHQCSVLISVQSDTVATYRALRVVCGAFSVHGH